MRVSASLRFPTLLIAAAALVVGASSVTAQSLSGGLFGPSLSKKQMRRAIEAAAAHPLGSEKNPVRVNMPGGERGYLDRLRCADGQAPKYDRSGSTGIGPFGNILDLYAVNCPGSTPAESSVYMDMYFADHVEPAAVPGFTITAP